jgi:hypothetical protein
MIILTTTHNFIIQIEWVTKICHVIVYIYMYIANNLRKISMIILTTVYNFIIEIEWVTIYVHNFICNLFCILLFIVKH